MGRRTRGPSRQRAASRGRFPATGHHAVRVSQQRPVGKQLFIAGVGYLAFNGGGTTLVGFNRALDPFVELTIADRRDPKLAACRALLVPESLIDRAVQISGMGHSAALPGVYTRNLAVLRLETFSGCKLVPRR